MDTQDEAQAALLGTAVTAAPDAHSVADHIPEHPVTAKLTGNGVGYGRPPVHSRFKPGQSGNPRGRRKASSNITLALKGALDESIAITEGKARKRVPKAKAFLLSLVNKAIGGDMKALVSVVKMGAKAGSIKPTPVPEKRWGTLIMTSKEFWFKSPEEKNIEIAEEAARRDAMLDAGLPYYRIRDPHSGRIPGKE